MVPLVDPAGTTRAGVGSEADADIVATGLSLTTLADGIALCLAGVALALAAPSREVAGDEAQPTRTTAANQTAADAAAPTLAQLTKPTPSL